MKRILFILGMALMVSGCGRPAPLPAGRMIQPAGQFSFVTPDGWVRTQLPGIDFIVVSTEPDYGASPNIFVEGTPRSGQISAQQAQLIEVNRNQLRSYTVLGQKEFATKSGLKGMKITAHRETQESLPLALYHYLFQDGDRVIVLTGSCSDPVKQKYEPFFDSAMRSLRAEP